MTPADDSAPPPKTMPLGPTQDDPLRSADFGQWAAPEIRRKGPDSLLGKTIGDRYYVKKLIGRGGMGAVYEAMQTAVQRTVALKVLLEEYAENESVIRRFHQEALAASRLAHPNTIKVYDFGQTDGMLYIAMEFLEGETVARVLARAGTLPPRRAIKILRQVVKSLAEAHKNGIIHRDLKPENIFLTMVEGEDDFAKVLDFGVAKLRSYEDETGTLTQAGNLFGTPKYMSPEHARSGALDARADLYSVGVILYELLLGAPPFVSENPLSVLLSQVHDTPDRFAVRRPDLRYPDALEAVVFKALAKDRDERYPSAQALLTDLDLLDAFLESGDSGLLARLPALDPPATIAPVSPLSPPEWSPPVPADSVNTRRGGPLGILAAAVVITFVVTAIALFAARDETNQTPRTAVTNSQAKARDAARPNSVDASTPTAAPKGVFFSLNSAPSKARIVHRDTGADVGTTPHRVEVFTRTLFVLKKAGFRDFPLELDPASGIREMTPKLIRRPKRTPPKVSPTNPPPPPRPTPVRVSPSASDPVLARPSESPGPLEDKVPMEFN